MSTAQSLGHLLVLAAVAAASGCGPVELPTAEPDRIASAAAPEVVDYTPITTCPIVITQPGKYRLEKDVSCALSLSTPPEDWFLEAILIMSDHVVLDLNGHRLFNRGRVAYGIAVGCCAPWAGGDSRHVADVTIRGPGFVSGFDWGGIFIQNSSHVTVTKLIVTGNVDYGVDIGGSSDVTIHDNVFGATEWMEVRAEGSSLRFLYNRIGGSPSWSGWTAKAGMEVRGNGNEIRGNVIEGASWPSANPPRIGLDLSGDGSLVTANQIHAETVALNVSGHGNKIIANRLSNDGLLEEGHNPLIPADIVDLNGCGANIYKGNWFTTARPACLQVPRVDW